MWPPQISEEQHPHPEVTERPAPALTLAIHILWGISSCNNFFSYFNIAEIKRDANPGKKERIEQDELR